MKLNNDSATPFYEQVAEMIQNDIKSGIFKLGDKIPSELELCSKFNVSRITIRRAIEELQKKDVLIKKAGKGTYVTYPKIIEDSNAGGSFTKSSFLINEKPSTKIISSEVIEVKDLSSNTARKIFKDHQKIICVKRVRMLNDIPMIFETDYFFGHQDFINSSDLSNVPLMTTITQNTGLIAETFEDMFDVKNVSAIIAKALMCPVNTPLLSIEQKVLTGEDELIYYNEQNIRQDLYKYVVKTRRNG